MGNTVWLVGMMGAGKSTIGAAIAEKLGQAFVDTDAEIERAAGRRISAIFERDGEPGFRARERAVIDALAGRDAVVALGGGAIAQPGASERLAATGAVVYLRARPETLLSRLGGCHDRPLLAGLAPEERLARVTALLEERAAFYDAAEITIDTDGLAPAEVAGAVVGRLEGGGEGA